MIQLGLYKEVLDFIDRPSSTTSTKAIGKHEKTHNQRVREFIGDVQDGNDLLSRLAATGYFDQQLDIKDRTGGLNTYRGILISSGFTSVVLAAVITPIDLVVFNQMQTRLFSEVKSDALKRISVQAVAKDIWNQKGLGFIGGMTLASNVTRYFFSLTSIYCVNNYQKSLAMED